MCNGLGIFSSLMWPDFQQVLGLNTSQIKNYVFCGFDFSEGSATSNFGVRDFLISL